MDVATGALRPRVAVGIAAVLNLAGAFLSVQVAKTISGGLVDDARITPVVIFAGLVGAIMWNLVTWLLGMLSSSSHALFGGLIGAVWVASGADAIRFGAVVGKVVLPAVISPVLAGIVALTATYLGYRVAARAGTLAPGSAPPFWVTLLAGLAIACGTHMGGWRIIRTLGRRISDIEPIQGFAAETTSSAVILASTHLGLPLSTTQVCTGAIFGAGAGRKLAAVRWSMAGRMALAWAVTLPAAAVVGAAASWLAATGLVGTVLVAVVGAGLAAGIYAMSRRSPVGALDTTDVPVPPARLAA